MGKEGGAAKVNQEMSEAAGAAEGEEAFVIAGGAEAAEREAAEAAELAAKEAAERAAREMARVQLNAHRSLLSQKRNEEKELVASIREARLAYEPLEDEDERWQRVGQLRRDQEALRRGIVDLRVAAGGVGGGVRRRGRGATHPPEEDREVSD